eukprot:TRINITY_DN2777_c1_g2_i1.p1 TRINITY_DN2777_c1_g2~~TRINITY_DN2777_c1_g2_i1.p1  ORF type:complete len:1061 (-),score=198.25 TRINITY_DN2777_c1_g2_i1:295-3477(-)
MVVPAERLFSVGGKGQTYSAEDIFRVASGSCQVVIDQSAFQRHERAGHDDSKGEKKAGKGPVAVERISGMELLKLEQTTDMVLSPEESRAVLLVRLLELMSGHGQKQLASLLVQYLKSDAKLAFPYCRTSSNVDSSVLQGAVEVVRNLSSDKLSTTNSAETSVTELAADNGKTPLNSLSPSDVTTFLNSVAPSLGISALAVHVASALIASADVIAALSCEAMQARTTTFDDQPGGHKGRTEVAARLRALLSGSTFVNPRKEPADLAAVHTIPQFHGAVKDALKAAATSIRSELNKHSESVEVSSKGGGGAAGSVPVVSSSPELIYHMAGVLHGVRPVLARSRHRIVFMSGLLRALESSSSSAQSSADVAAGGSSANGVATHNAPAGSDMDTALQQAEETVELVKKASAGEQLALADADVEDSHVLSGVGVARETLSAVEATRMVLALEAVVACRLLRRREESLAAKQGGSSEGKAAGKEGKKGKGAGPVLGKGTSMLKQVLEKALVENPRHGGRLLEQVEVVADALDPRKDVLACLLEDLKPVLEGNETRRTPKIPKGTRDFLPEQMAIREKAFAIITGAFKRHGGVEIDTPVFELRETLMGKYGEDSKLVYDLADQGGEILSLRYDLTVPFARYLAMHPIGNVKRYHIARVYRRDNPQLSRGRYREFYQCDFDIAGQYATMVPDAEILRVVTELLDRLAIGDYEIKVNHRRLLDGMLDLCGVPASKFRPICSAIDKLDKEPWDAVRTEMISEKGLPTEVVDRIGLFVVKRGRPEELLAELMATDGPFKGHEGSLAALAEMALLFRYLGSLGALHRVVFDLSLARGLDYYTGMIFEGVFKGGEAQVGSIAGGGRYDHLVGMFSGKPVPAVGLSLGIERVFTIMEAQLKEQGSAIRSTQTEVLVASIGSDMLEKRMDVARELWDADIKAEYVPALASNMQKQMEFANKYGIPWCVIFGDTELTRGTVKVKDLVNRTEEEVPRGELVQLLKERLGHRLVKAGGMDGERQGGGGERAVEGVGGNGSSNANVQLEALKGVVGGEPGSKSEAGGSECCWSCKQPE